MARADGEPTGSPTGSPPPPKYKSLNEILSAVTVKQESRPKTSRASAHGEAMKNKNRHKQSQSTTAQARPLARKPGSSKAARHDSDDESEPRSSRRPSHKDEVVFGTCVFIPEGPKAFIGKADPPSVALSLEATQYGFCVTAKAEGDLAIPRDSTYRDLKVQLRDIVPAAFEVIDKAIDARLEAGATEKDMRSLGEFKLLNKEGRKLTVINIAEPTGEHAAIAVTKASRWRERTLYIAAPFDVTEWCLDNVLAYLPCKRPNTREDALRAQRMMAASQEGQDASEDEQRARKGKSKRKRSESPELFDKSPPRPHRRPTKRCRRRSPDSPVKLSAGAARPSTSADTISIHDSDSEPEGNSAAVVQGSNTAGLDSSDALLTDVHFAELEDLLRSGFPAVNSAASVPPGAPTTLPISNGDSAPVFSVASASSAMPIPSMAPLLPGTVTSDPVPHTPIPQHTIVTGFGFGSPPKNRNWLDEF